MKTSSKHKKQQSQQQQQHQPQRITANSKRKQLKMDYHIMLSNYWNCFLSMVIFIQACFCYRARFLSLFICLWPTPHHLWQSFSLSSHQLQTYWHSASLWNKLIWLYLKFILWHRLKSRKRFREKSTIRQLFRLPTYIWRSFLLLFWLWIHSLFHWFKWLLLFCGF